MIKKKLTKLLSMVVLTSVFSIGFLFLHAEEANAYNAGGDGTVTFNSFDINNFNNSSADLWTQTRANYDPEKIKNRVVYGDFDGNGKDEVAAFYDYGNNNAEIHRLYQDGGKYYNASAWTSEVGNFYAPSITGRVVAGDFNGDGKDEIMALYYHYDTTATMFQFSLDSNTQNFSMKSVWEATGVDDEHMASMVAGDFDGDGKDEILLFYYYENNVTGMFEIKMGSDGKLTSRKAWESTTYDATRIKGKTVAGDFNGDGKDEVAMFYDYGNEKTKIWSLYNQNNSYVVDETWYGDLFNAAKITDKVVATHNKEGVKDKIISLYDYGNNITGIFTWELQSNKFVPIKEKELTNYEADRITGRVAVGKFDGQVTRITAMHDGTVVKSQTQADKVIAEAYTHLGKPYVWGGNGPDVFDCSGFTKYVYKEAVGITLPRVTYDPGANYDQLHVGVPVSQSDLQPGDLVFPHTGHVGIYVGDGKIIHAPEAGDVVKISPIWSFYAARRVL